MLSPLSILIPIKNRTIINVEHEDKKYELRLFEKNLESLFAVCTAEDRWEIVIVDFESTDVSMKTWLNMRNPPPQCSIRLIPVEGDFSRGRGINIGIENSSYPTLLILDADMEIKTHKFFEDIETHVVNKNLVFFPICYSYTNPEHTEGYKRAGGTGIYSIQRSMFRPIIENISWGKEDTENFNFFEKKAKTAREFYGEEYVHQWHPTSLDFKNKYYMNKEAIIPKFPVPEQIVVPKTVPKTVVATPRFLPNSLLYQTSFPKKVVEDIKERKETKETKQTKEVKQPIRIIGAIETIDQESPTNQRGSIEAFLLRKTHGTRSNLFLRKR